MNPFAPIMCLGLLKKKIKSTLAVNSKLTKDIVQESYSSITLPCFSYEENHDSNLPLPSTFFWLQLLLLLLDILYIQVDCNIDLISL